MKISGNLCLPDNSSSPSCDGRSNRVQAVLKMTYFCEKGHPLHDLHNNMRKGAYVRFTEIGIRYRGL